MDSDERLPKLMPLAAGDLDAARSAGDLAMSSETVERFKVVAAKYGEHSGDEGGGAG